MANVGFKRGAQATLTQLNGYAEGSFYLTTDTDRLYFAQTANKLVELNKSITVVDYINTTQQGYTSGNSVLPTQNIAEGQFYYVKNSNILCVYLNNDWIQINPDTNTTYEISAVGVGSQGTDGYTGGYLISLGGNNSTTEKFYNTSQTYKKSEVNDLITAAKNSINAMQYKGVISSTSELTNKLSSATNCIGDTYIATANGINYSYNGTTMTFNTGDLIILNGTENNGYITIASIYIDSVPASTPSTITTLEWQSF